MTSLIAGIHAHVVAPTRRNLGLGLRLHWLIWTRYFDEAWEATPLSEKLTWLMFMANTLCILTLIEILAFK